MISMEQVALHRAVLEYVLHYPDERNHQGLDNRLIFRCPTNAAKEGHIHHLNGLVRCSILTIQQHETLGLRFGEYEFSKYPP